MQEDTSKNPVFQLSMRTKLGTIGRRLRSPTFYKESHVKLRVTLMSQALEDERREYRAERCRSKGILNSSGEHVEPSCG